MKVTVKITDDSLLRNLTKMQTATPDMLETVAKTAGAMGKEYARDIITQLIYATPERSGYKRTRTLLRSIYSAVERKGDKSQIIVGASAYYAPFNELGTYDGYLGEGMSEEQIIADARRRLTDDLITLEYGRVEKGLEPRPFILPAIIMIERELPQIIEQALNRLLDDA